MRARERRPTEEAPNEITGGRSTHSLAAAATTDLPLLARRADYALRVVSVRRDGRLLTRFYATLAGAEAALHRAHGRGCAAALQLVRIVPTSIALADVEHLLGEDGGQR